MPKKRIDCFLVEKGLAGTRSRAQALLMAGKVIVNDRPVTKPGTLVPPDAALRLRGVLPYASRGGIKLEHALDSFALAVAGLAAADIGASTGGFTDCLLKRGAARVYAIDVGRSQLDERLRNDPRVTVLDRVNARHPLPLPGKVDIATIDVSFISATRVIPSALASLKPRGAIVLLLKPQFEASRAEIASAKGGVIKDPTLHALILGRFIRWVVDYACPQPETSPTGQVLHSALGLSGLITSPIAGASGNKEFLLLLRPHVTQLLPLNPA